MNYGPKIVTDGLVLALDAADKKSYPGSGTTWNDLTQNSYINTLTNGPTFNSSKGGNIVFDGIDDYVNCATISQITNANEITVELFVKINGTSTGTNNWGGQYLIFKKNSRTTQYEGFILYYHQDNKYFAAGASSSTGTQTGVATISPVSTQTIYHVAATYKSNDVIKIYLNGNFEASVAIAYNLDIPSTSSCKIGRTADSFEGPANASIYNVKLYNRVLSATEIKNNFNAQRGRFGI